MRRSIQSRIGGPAGRPFVICTILALSLLIPAAATAQSDLAVTSCFTHEPYGTPGGDVLLEFTIENIGSAPTTISSIMNFVVIWADSTLEEQISPTVDHTVHTYRPLAIGEVDMLGPLSVHIPPDIPYDTVITIAVWTDFPDLEAELYEDNNIWLLPLPIGPPEIVLEGLPFVRPDTCELGYYTDIYELGTMDPSSWTWIEAEGPDGAYDPRLFLMHDMYPDTLVGYEADLSGIDPGSRLIWPMTGSLQRLIVFGEDGTTGRYDLTLQHTIDEGPEPNDGFPDAMPIDYGDAVRGMLNFPGDVDFYVFSGDYGDIVRIDVDADEAIDEELGVPPDSTLDPMVVLYNSAGDTLHLQDDEDEFDPNLYFVLPTADDYYLAVEDGPGEGEGTGYPNYWYVFKISQTEGVGLPDLTPSYASLFSDSVPAGNWVQLDLETANIGELGTFADVVHIDIMLSVDPVIDPYPIDSIVAIGDFDGQVPSMGYAPTQVQFELPSNLTEGQYYLGIVLDPNEIETEEDEANNEIVIPLYVKDVATDAPDPMKFPKEFALMQNYPNPVSDATSIVFHLPGSNGRSITRHVKIEVYNVAGQRVATVLDGPRSSGVQVIGWNGRVKGGRRLSSGVYFYRMTVGSFSQTRRMILIR